MTNPLRILIADDHPLLRMGLRQTIEGDPSLRVVAEVGDGDAALTQIEALRPDVIVLDIDMPARDGFDVLREMQKRRLSGAVIFLTFHADEEVFNEAIDLGVKGYLLKDSALTAIIDGIRAVAAGQHYVTPSLTTLLVRHRASAQALAERQPGLESLTPTERRILRLIANGQSSKEIADALFIHYRTVENHRVNIAQKLGLRGHNAVLKFALAHKAEF
jgi:DNA-binding NarL/FixJ family response regulator